MVPDATEHTPSSGSGDEPGPAETMWERGSGKTPVYAVVTAIADRTDRDPVSLPPLADAIDPDALNRLFPSSDASAPGYVSFRYCGYIVVVSGDGTVRLRRTDDAS